MSALTDEEIDKIWEFSNLTLPQIVTRRMIVRAGIAANTAKVLADLKPEFRCVYSQHRQKLENAYSADQVAALVQERDAMQSAMNDILDLYDFEVPNHELARRFYDAKCIAATHAGKATS